MENLSCNNCGKSNPGNYKYCAACGHELPKALAEIPIEASHQPIIRKQKLSVKNIIGIVVGIATMVALQQFFFSKPTYSKVMMDFASELNKTCPVMVDKETRLDNAIALPDNVFQYNYTLVNLERSAVDTTALRDAIEPNIFGNVRTNPQMKPQRDNKTTLNYYYKDKNGEFLLLVSVTPDKYE